MENSIKQMVLAGVPAPMARAIAREFASQKQMGEQVGIPPGFAECPAASSPTLFAGQFEIIAANLPPELIADGDFYLINGGSEPVYGWPSGANNGWAKTYFFKAGESTVRTCQIGTFDSTNWVYHLPEYPPNFWLDLSKHWIEIPNMALAVNSIDPGVTVNINVDGGHGLEVLPGNLIVSFLDPGDYYHHYRVKVVDGNTLQLVDAMFDEATITNLIASGKPMQLQAAIIRDYQYGTIGTGRWQFFISFTIGPNQIPYDWS